MGPQWISLWLSLGRVWGLLPSSVHVQGADGAFLGSTCVDLAVLLTLAGGSQDTGGFFSPAKQHAGVPVPRRIQTRDWGNRFANHHLAGGPLPTAVRGSSRCPGSCRGLKLPSPGGDSLGRLGWVGRGGIGTEGGPGWFAPNHCVKLLPPPVTPQWSLSPSVMPSRGLAIKMDGVCVKMNKYFWLFLLCLFTQRTVLMPMRPSEPWPHAGSAPSPLPTLCCLEMSSCSWAIWDLAILNLGRGLWELVHRLSRPGSPWRPFNLILRGIPFSPASATLSAPPGFCPTSWSCVSAD